MSAAEKTKALDALLFKWEQRMTHDQSRVTVSGQDAELVRDALAAALDAAIAAEYKERKSA